MEKGGRGSALNIFSIFNAHHRIPNEHMMTINFDTITNNNEVIYVIKTVMKYYLKKNRYEFSVSVFQIWFNVYLLIWFMNIHEQNHPWFLAMDSLPIVVPGNACTEHPLISVTYLGIEAERIVPIFLLKTPGNIYKYKHLNI